jgi:acyl-CoA reductase-like NAD-dependent aldehyde dehydrogenase
VWQGNPAGLCGNLKRVTLELGGKSPVIVFPDAALEPATEIAARGIFMNSGQVCAAGSRLFVHEKVFDQVVDGVVSRAASSSSVPAPTQRRKLVRGAPMCSGQRVMGFIASGRSDGAKVTVGGTAPAGQGYFVEPTVLADTTQNMRVVREEIFGPVLCAMKFSDTDLDAIARMANDTDYGLAASIWTRDISTAHKLAKKIRAGSVRINTAGTVDPSMPLGGYQTVRWGRENGREGTEIYTEVKSVTVGL